MKLCSQLKFISLLSVIPIILIGMFLVLNTHSLHLAAEKTKFVHEAIRQISYIRSIIFDYERSQTKQVEQQFHFVSQRLTEVFTQAQFTEPSEIILLEKIQEDYQKIQLLFTELKHNNNSLNHLEQEERLLAKGYSIILSSKLFILSERIVNQAFQLHELINTNFLKKRNVRNFLYLLIMSVITLSIITISFFLSNNIKSSIAHLLDIAHQINHNNLTYVIPQKETNEFREVYAAFGQMTSHINTTYQGLQEEIKERKKAEDTLRSNLQFLETLLDTIPSPVFYKNTEGIYQGCNEAFAKQIAGVPKKKIIGHSLHNLPIPIPQDLARIYHEHDIILLREPSIHSYEEQVQCIDNIRRDFLFTKATYQDVTGHVVGIIGVMLDITTRKQTEEQMRHLQNLLKNMIDSMPSILIGVDLNVKVTQWNHEAENVTGISAEKAQGQDLTEIFPQLAGKMESIHSAIQQREPQKHGSVILQNDKEPRYSDITIYPLLVDRVEGAVIRVDDVTERVHMEEMMIQSEKMMTVGGLAAGMAHEINNPLGVILQGIQNTLRRLSPEVEKNQEIAEACDTDLVKIQTYLEQRNIIQYLNGIREAGLRASKIVTDMLNFSRCSESKMLPTNINHVLDKTIGLAANDYDLKKKYDFKHINIIREYDSTLPEILCAETEIEQVILNLLKNAAQAIAEKSKNEYAPQIRICTRKDQDYALIELEDNGPGINEDIRKHIFEPFYTTKTVGIGTGLGLSVSYFIITNNHQGTMAVESSLNRGTKFIIRLPFERNR